MFYNSKQYHTFHLVDPSPWPFFASISALTTTLGGVAYMHGYDSGFTLFFGLATALYTLSLWWRDVIREGTYEGHHTKIVQNSLRFGFMLFIVSEVMFFFGFFWAFFHSSLSPAIEIGCCWPPTGIQPFYAWGIPLMNTCILLLSGFFITAAHHFILNGGSVALDGNSNEDSDAESAVKGTVILGLLFTYYQLIEYLSAPFTISDGIYGSVFYMATGFHGLHVLIGTSFIVVCLCRLQADHFTRTHHVGFEAAAWYWHFVDVVWLFLFVAVYWWGGISIYSL